MNNTIKNEKILVDDIAGCDPRRLPEILRSAAAAKDEQQAVLMDIIAHAENSVYGKEHDFSSVASIADFRQRVPVTEFDDYRDEIEKMKAGESDRLFSGETESFVMTSGTTGNPKYIPESCRGSLVKKIVGDMRTVEIMRMIPQLMQEDTKILTITNASVYGKTESGIPCGSASGQAAEAGGQKDKLVLPLELLSMQDISLEAMDYLTMMFAAAEKNVCGVVCNNIAHFSKLMERLNRDADKILSDIDTGQISADITEETRKKLLHSHKKNHDRYLELKKIYENKKRFSVEDIWPGFIGASCWMSGSVGRTVKEFRDTFPEHTLFIEWGYGASEGKFNIPVESGVAAGIPAVFGYFFEFLPVGGGDVLTLAETETGKKYELITTSYSGFYRYNMHDIVKIGETAGIKTMEFICKESDKAVFGDKMIYAGDITEIIEAYEKDNDVFFRLFQAKASDGGLEMFIEPAGSGYEHRAFEEYMKRALADRGIELKHINVMEPGHRDSLFARSLTSGKSVNQTKLPVFVK